MVDSGASDATSDENDINRRLFLRGTATLGAAGVGALAGCSGNQGGSTTTTTSGGGGGETSGGETTASSQQRKPLQIQHFWTAGGEKQAITALFEGFREKYPDIEIEPNPVAGGGGQNLRTVIKERILNNNPPSTWQAWPGKNLMPYAESGHLKDIESLVWDHNGMKDHYNEGVQQTAKPTGNYVWVPLNVHRPNSLFYNVQLVEEAGVDPNSLDSPQALVEACQAVEEQTDAAGMAKTTKAGIWITMFWESLLIATGGPEAYNAVKDNGEVSKYESEVKEAFNYLKKYKDFFTDDASSLTWDQAGSKLVSGDAAFFHMGDWAAGLYFASDNFAFGDDWDQITFPGTEGIYHMNMDGFGYPIPNNPSPQTTTLWLRYLGTTDAQERFNPKKGSIPPRTDASKEPFDDFLKGQMDDFANTDAALISMTLGGVRPETYGALNTASKNFTSGWNVDKVYQAYVNAFS